MYVCIYIYTYIYINDKSFESKVVNICLDTVCCRINLCSRPSPLVNTDAHLVLLGHIQDTGCLHGA